MRDRIEVVVDGTDGAGKTPCVEHLVHRFAARGLQVVSHAPYREREVYPLWETDPQRAARTIVQVMARFRAAHPDADVVVWDRGWPTAFISTEDAAARALFEPLPAVTILLLSTMDRTRDTAKNHPSAGVWATDEALIRRYNAAYHRLEASEPHSILRALPDSRSRYDLPSIGAALDAELERRTPRRGG